MINRDKKLAEILLIVIILSIILYSGAGPASQYADTGMALSDEINQYYMEDSLIGTAACRLRDDGELDQPELTGGSKPFHIIKYISDNISFATCSYKNKQSLVADDIFKLNLSSIFIASYVHRADGKKHIL